jgi:CheY-like chemotaxis protein
VAKLLVVDDEAEGRTMLRRMLAGLGHGVWDVDDGGGPYGSCGNNILHSLST